MLFIFWNVWTFFYKKCLQTGSIMSLYLEEKKNNFVEQHKKITKEQMQLV